MKTETALHIRLSANPAYRDFMNIVRGSLGFMRRHALPHGKVAEILHVLAGYQYLRR